MDPVGTAISTDPTVYWLGRGRPRIHLPYHAFQKCLYLSMHIENFPLRHVGTYLPLAHALSVEYAGDWSDVYRTGRQSSRPSGFC